MSSEEDATFIADESSESKPLEVTITNQPIAEPNIYDEADVEDYNTMEIFGSYEEVEKYEESLNDG